MILTAKLALASSEFAKLSRTKPAGAPQREEALLCCEQLEVEFSRPSPSQKGAPPALAMVWVKLARAVLPKGEVLLIRDQKGVRISLSERKNVKGFQLPLNDEVTRFSVARVLASGESVSSEWQVAWQSWKTFAKSPQDFLKRNYWFSVGAASSLLTYSETALESGILLGLTAKVNAGYTFPFGLTLGGKCVWYYTGHQSFRARGHEAQIPGCKCS